MLDQIVSLLTEIRDRLPQAPGIVAPQAPTPATPQPPPPAPVAVQATVSTPITLEALSTALISIVKSGPTGVATATAAIAPFQSDPPIAPGPYPNIKNVDPSRYAELAKAIAKAAAPPAPVVAGIL